MFECDKISRATERISLACLNRFRLDAKSKQQQQQQANYVVLMPEKLSRQERERVREGEAAAGKLNELPDALDR